MKKNWLVILFLLLLGSLSACGGDHRSADSPQITWNSCDEQDGECARFPVPLDYEDPDGTKLDLALIRFSATEEKLGSVFVNPGGPGASAVEFVDYFKDTELGQNLRKNFDLMAFDPRGVGQSSQVRCVDNPVPYVGWSAPTSLAELNQIIDIVQDYTSQCAEKNAELLEHVSSDEVVKDMELIRQALGEGGLNFIGLSYGSKLGALYADKYPQNVRALVLDGVMSPSLTSEELSTEQLAGFEGQLMKFLDRCAENESCLFGAGEPRGTLEQLLEQLGRQPLPAVDERVLTRGDAETALAMALYSESYWPFLEQALADAAAGDGSKLLVLSDRYHGRDEDGTYRDSIYDAFNAVRCIDDRAPSLEEILLLAEESAQSYPFLGPSFTFGDLICTYWPVAPVSEPRVVDTRGAPQIMVVGTTGDPATPYPWARLMAEELDSSFLVTFEGDVHCAIGESSCVDQMYEHYLLNPEAGYADINCFKDVTTQPVAAKSSGNSQSFEAEIRKLKRRW